MSIFPRFGAALRNLREERGLTLQAVAELVHTSPSHLSRIERGERTVQPDFARLCDARLDANGTLASLVPDTPGKRDVPPSVPPEPPVPVEYGDALALRPVEDLLAILEQRFTQVHRDGAGGFGLPASRDAVTIMRVAAHYADWPGGELLLPLAARAAELAGWLAQDSADAHAAVRLTDEAARLGERAGERDAVAYAMVRHAEMKMYAGNAMEALGYAERALGHDGAAPRTRGLAHHRAAQAYAMIGERAACRAHLDASGEALRAGGLHAGAYGPSTVLDPTALVNGWCLYRFGEFREAAEVLEKAVAELPEYGARLRGLFGARLARAHAEAGQVERAIETGATALACARQTRSATAAGQLQRLSSLLSRYPAHPAAETLRAAIVAELRRRDEAA
ncbi:transcriptional regulator [Sphaerisporangium krabiense]|uniref:Transcriptional regulator with XRE-family HTH domain n=1 Tax=Sphaerisporangium krabiense TaxID=763782 RepID=A0A7W8Z6B2_9ACTN|nr:helix-turn-helix domain-containing protein [Sphaerisporangium krabiense]MBB5628145.1 transcriptional regulator with XRE-family HTH domain [Sphaerisporangium krabiense]GII62314.1 transcriptional regulator [Sphaerisporangium krabiense]